MSQEKQISAVVRILKRLVDNFHQTIDWDEVEAYLLAGLKNAAETDKEFDEIQKAGETALAAIADKKEKKKLFSATIPDFPDDDIPF